MTLEQRLAEYISIPSVNPALGGTGEAALAERVADDLRGYGADVVLQPVAEGRFNVVAALQVRPGPAVLLEAHLDTVAVGEGWKRSPFGGAIEQGRVYGRGACDTKGSLVTLLEVFAHFARNPRQLAQPLIFAATIDEEVAQTGAYALMQDHWNLAGAVTGEPSRCGIVHAHKGFVRLTVRTRGRAAHSSRPAEGVNAILRMGEILRRLEDHAVELESRIPHPSLGGGTISVGTISGGSGVNVVPAHCQIQLDRRTLPGESAETVLAELQRQLAGLQDWTLEDVVARPPLFTDPEGPFVRSLRRAIAAGGREPRLEAAPYLTNAVAYAAAGVPAVAFGPGDVALAHRPDEYIEIEDLYVASNILRQWLEQPVVGEIG
jgi:acetylornithine deacetylase/succinyl-diaminopimelate desuccinylase family protein